MHLIQILWLGTTSSHLYFLKEQANVKKYRFYLEG